MKQTAVEWLADQIQEQLDVFLPGAVLDNKMIEQAKAMEKEQIKLDIPEKSSGKSSVLTFKSE